MICFIIKFTKKRQQKYGKKNLFNQKRENKKKDLNNSHELLLQLKIIQKQSNLQKLLRYQIIQKNPQNYQYCFI